MTTAVASLRTWAEMIKLSHSVFALPFALIATFLAGRNVEPLHRPAWGQLALIVACMVAARSVAMTFNRIVDAAIDARNPRTAGRPLPAGRLTRKAAIVFLIVAACCFVAACYGFLHWYANPWPLRLSVLVLSYLCGYSYTKRFTRWSHFYLGSAIGLSPLAAWLAVDPPSVGLPAVMLCFTVMMWIAGFDIIYACQDIDHDRAERLFSLPSRVGAKSALTIARGAHGIVILLLVALAYVASLGWLYLVGVAAAGVLLVIENSLVRPDDFSRVNLAFFTINGVVSLALGLLTILDVLWLTRA